MADLGTTTKAPWFPVATAMLGCVGGFFVDIGKDIVKERYSRRRSRREEHAQEILREVLSPICDYLKEFYLPVCQLRRPPLGVRNETINRRPDHIAEDTFVRTEIRVWVETPSKPGRAVFLPEEPWQESDRFRRLYKDALQNHHSELLRRWQAFIENYGSIVGAAKVQAEALAGKLQEAAALPPLLASGREPPTWANYSRIAVLVLHRRLGVNVEGLCFRGSDRTEVRTARTQDILVKCATAQESDRVVNVIDELAKDLASVEDVKMRFGQLAVEAARLIEDCQDVLAKKPELKKCPFA
ncbi:MAG: hypothetical protein HY924_11045 [Elusimicrobia bacterium]|nr:hypothetical protein [Elusimicrobiota bacterium]